MIETGDAVLQDTSIDERIGAVYGSLSPQLRRAARYLSDHPDDIAVHSMRRIAREADVPPSTMTRLAQALDFEGYEALRDEFRSRVVGAGGFAKHASRLQTRAPDDPVSDGLLQRHADAAIGNIQATLSTISEPELQAAADMLLSCDRVAVIGVLSSFSMAAYTQYIAGMALSGWSLIGAEGDSFADRLTDLTPEDGVLAIAYAPYGRRSSDAAQRAKERGCKVVAVTDSRLAPLASIADRALIVRTQAQHFFPSGVAVVTVLEALIGACIASAGDKAVHRLSEVEQARREFGDYWRDET